jgi:uncharacterized protein (TIGR02246 family)
LLQQAFSGITSGRTATVACPPCAALILSAKAFHFIVSWRAAFVLLSETPKEEAMQVRYIWPAAVALAVILAGCNQTPPVLDTRDADARAIHKVETAWNQAFATRDVNKVAAFYSDDASVFLPGTPVINGAPAIKAALKPMLADKKYSLVFTSTKTEVSKASDIAYSQGTYTSRHTDPKTKQVLTEKGKYVTVYKKQADGTWKAVADSVSYDAPAEKAK